MLSRVFYYKMHYADCHMLAWFSDCPGHSRPHTLSPFSECVLGLKQPGPSKNEANHMQAFRCAMRLVVLALEVPRSFTFSKFPCSETAKHSYFMANMEASEQEVKTDWDWGEPSNKSNDLTTLNIRCHFISYNLNMLTNYCLAS